MRLGPEVALKTPASSRPVPDAARARAGDLPLGASGRRAMTGCRPRPGWSRPAPGPPPGARACPCAEARRRRYSSLTTGREDPRPAVPEVVAVVSPPPRSVGKLGAYQMGPLAALLGGSRGSGSEAARWVALLV